MYYFILINTLEWVGLSSLFTAEEAKFEEIKYSLPKLNEPQ